MGAVFAMEREVAVAAAWVKGTAWKAGGRREALAPGREGGAAGSRGWRWGIGRWKKLKEGSSLTTLGAIVWEVGT
jgi:hypothetical protein